MRARVTAHGTSERTLARTRALGLTNSPAQHVERLNYRVFSEPRHAARPKERPQLVSKRRSCGTRARVEPLPAARRRAPAGVARRHDRVVESEGRARAGMDESGPCYGPCVMTRG
jgi:hypothetical protein